MRALRFLLPLLLALAGWFGPAAPVRAQDGIEEPVPAARAVADPKAVAAAAMARGNSADALAQYLRALAANPRDLEALTGAGRAALTLDDPEAAIAFYARAEEIAPRDGRVKAGLGAAMVRQRNPRAALRFFDEATDLGVPVADIAADRGLAYDLRGDTRRAQADYQIALAAHADAETIRHLAVSQAIAGNRDQALQTLDPLLRRQDIPAWRTRAYVFAIVGDPAEAEKAAAFVMAAPQVAAMAPYLRRIGTLKPAEKVAAVDFGYLPAGPMSAAELAAAPVAVAVNAPAPQPVQVAANASRRRRAAPIARAADAPAPDAPPTPPVLAETTPVPMATAAAMPVVAVSSPPREQAAESGSRRRRGGGPGAVATASVLAERMPAPVRGEAPAPAAAVAARPVVEESAPPRRQAADSVSRRRNGAPGAVTRPALVEATPAPVVTGASSPSSGEAAARHRDVVAGDIPSSAGPSPVVPSPVVPSPVVPSSVVPSAGAAVTRSAMADAGPAPAVIAPRMIPGAMPRAEIARVDPVEGGDAGSDRPARTDATIASAGRSEAPASVPEPVVQLAVSNPISARPAADAPSPATGAVDTQVPAVEAPPPAAPVIDRAALAAAARAKAAADAKAAAAAAAKDKADRLAAQKAAKAKTERDAIAAAEKAEEKAEKAEAARQAKIAKANPERQWVQVAGGANKATLPKAWAALLDKHKALLAGRSPWTVHYRFTNRLMVGPFKSDDEAQDFVNRAAKAGLPGFAVTTAAGEAVEKVAAP